MSEFKVLVGIDWATVEHEVVVLDSTGTQVAGLKVKHDGEALERFAEQLLVRGSGDPASIGVAIEMTADAVIEVLLDRGIAVFGINPKQADRFRDRHSVGGAKDDRRDAFVLADALRTDQRLFRRLVLGTPELVELREMSRARSALVADVTALGNRLWSVLHRYFPALLDLGSPHEDRWLLELVEMVPTPAAVRHLKRSKVEALLKRHHIRRVDTEKVLAALQRRPLPVAPGVAEAASAHALLLVKLLRTTLDQRDRAADRIEELLARPESSDDDVAGPPRKHRDVDILLSLPGAGPIVGATVLAEATSALAGRDYQALRVRAGVAPITRQTGKQRPQHVMRRACHPRLRDAVHFWSGVAIRYDERLRALYLRLRESGKSSGRARRGVSDRLLAMLISMLKTGELYDPARRAVPAAAAQNPAKSQPQPA